MTPRHFTRRFAKSPSALAAKPEWDEACGSELKALMERIGVNDVELARHVPVTDRSIRSWCSGVKPLNDNLRNLARAIDKLAGPALGGEGFENLSRIVLWNLAPPHERGRIHEENQSLDARSWILASTLLIAAAATLLIVSLARGPGQRAAHIQFDRAGITLLDEEGAKLTDASQWMSRFADPHDSGSPGAPGKGKACLVNSRQRPLVAVASPQLGSLFLVDPTLREEVSRFTIPFTLMAATDPDINFEVTQIESIDTDSNDRSIELALVLTEKSRYLTQVLILRFDKTWEVLREFWSAGVATVSGTIDLLGDGRIEVVVAGGSNDFQQVVVSILELDGKSSRSPTGPRQLPLREAGTLPETGVHIRLPRSHLSLSPEFETVRSAISRREHVTIDDVAGRIRLLVTDVKPQSKRDESLDALVEFIVDTSDCSVTASLGHNYDFYLANLKKHLAQQDIADEWRISEDRLDLYERDLASQTLILSRGSDQWSELASRLDCVVPTD